MRVLIWVGQNRGTLLTEMNRIDYQGGQATTELGLTGIL